MTIIVFAGNFVLFCFGSKIRRNGQESLFWESLHLARKRHLHESPQGRIQKIQIAVAGKLASYMDSFYFAAVIVKIIQKSTEKKGVVETPSRPSSKSPHGPDGVLQSCLDSIFFPFPTPQCSPV